MQPEKSAPRLRTSHIPPQSLLSTDDRPSDQIRKIDNNGRYQRYDNITIVMPTSTQRLQLVYQSAFDTIRKYPHIITALPVSSYHVTLWSIMSRREYSTVDEYNADVTALHPLFERFKYLLSREDGFITFSVRLIRGAHRTAVALALEPKTAADARKLEKLNSSANRTFGNLFRRQRVYHMTMGYYVPNVADEEEKRLEMIKTLNETFADIDIVVEMPRLCAVTSMEAFPPV